MAQSQDVQNSGAPPILDSDDPSSRQNYFSWNIRKKALELGIDRIFDFVSPLEIAFFESITPDRSWVLFEGLDIGANGMSFYGSGNFYLINLDTGEKTLLKMRGVLSPALSVDAEKIAFIDSDNAVYVMDIVSQIPRKLIALEADYQGVGLTFKPDNSALGLVAHYMGEAPDNGDSTDTSASIALILKADLQNSNVSMRNAVVKEYHPATFERLPNGLTWEGESFDWRWFD